MTSAADRLLILSSALADGTLARFAPLASGMLLAPLNVTLNEALPATLATLCAFDDAAVAVLRRSSLYMLYDATVCNVLGAPADGALLEALATCGFVYRFPAAAKFGYSIDAPQLRISSWGREVAGRLPAALAYARSYRTATCALQEYRGDYLRLIALCDSPDRPLDTTTLQLLNAHLPLPILT